MNLLPLLIGLLSAIGLAQDSPIEPCRFCARRPDPTVAGVSPFTPGCNGQQSGTNYRNAPSEPWIAVDPANPRHMVGVWQQDRWSSGASSGNLTGATFDGGDTWRISFAQFSTCSGGGYDRASDPWVSFSPDGSVYQISLALSNCSTVDGSNTCAISAVMVAKSTDGGATWDAPVTLIEDGAAAFNDKETITADPFEANYVYAVWDRSTGSESNNTYHQPAYLARTVNGGVTWEAPQVIYDPGVNQGVSGNQIVVLPNGTLVDIFDAFDGDIEYLGVVRSADHGQTWSAPTEIALSEVNGIVDVKTGVGIRVGAGLPAIAVDPNSGALYVAWEDSRFSAHQRDGVVLSKSTDGGLTWSAPVQVNQAPTVQAFEPAITVGAGGAVAIDYFDFRQDNGNLNSLLTSSWRIVSHDGGNTWDEFPLLPPFNLLNAPAGAGYFLGDYHSVAPSGDSFVSFLVIANPPGSSSQNEVKIVSTVERGDTRTIAAPQVYLHRLRPKLHERPPRR